MKDRERKEVSGLLIGRDVEYFVRKMVGEMSWKRDENILDYGCGTEPHLILPSVESNDSKLFSVDKSKEKVEFARKTYGKPNVTFAVGNVLSDDFPFSDIQFDKIFAIFVLHFVRDYRKVLERFHGLLKPRGYLGFNILISKMLEINRTLGMDDKWSKYLKGCETFIPEWIDETENVGGLFRKCLEDVGFEVASLEVQKREFVCSKFENLIEFHLSLNPLLKKIPERLRSDFRQEHRYFLIQHCNVKLRGDAARLNYQIFHQIHLK